MKMKMKMNPIQYEGKTKPEMYKTAFYPEIGQFVGLLKYHKYANYYDIETISKTKMRVLATELTDFCL